MKTGAIAAYAVRSCRPACRKIIRKMIVNIGAVKNGISPSGIGAEEPQLDPGAGEERAHQTVSPRSPIICT